MSARRAVVLGGTGGIGSAVVRRLLRDADDWDVDVIARRGGPVVDELVGLGARFVPGDRRDASVLRDVLRDGADLLVDGVGATGADARQLLPYLDDVGSSVYLSTKAVYVDEQGRHANSLDRPVFPVPVRETQPTVAPDDGDPTSRDGYAANRVAAEHALLDHGAPVTVLRAGRVHGVGVGRPREWYFVRRVRDGRERLVLADRGASVDQTSSAVGIAELVALVADRPGQRILNAADPDAPSVLEIGRTVARHMGHTWDEVLLDADAPAFLGANPWRTASPVVLDVSAAGALGFVAPGTFAETVVPELDWMVDEADRADAAGIDVPWASDPFFERSFDYGPEDAALMMLFPQI